MKTHLVFKQRIVLVDFESHVLGGGQVFTLEDVAAGSSVQKLVDVVEAGFALHDGTFHLSQILGVHLGRTR